MPDITVTCGCGREMSQRGTDPKGTYRCGCGARVTLRVSEQVTCVWRACRLVPMRRTDGIDLPLCAGHFAELARALEALRVGDVTARKAELDERELVLADREWEIQNWHDQQSADPWIGRSAIREAHAFRDTAANWYVYYMRIGDRIKIGTTRDLPRRVTQLMPDELLAVEPGDRAVEHQRHTEFAELRIRGERFQPAPELLDHIERLRQEHGVPGPTGQLPRKLVPKRRKAGVSASLPPRGERVWLGPTPPS